MITRFTRWLLAQPRPKTPEGIGELEQNGGSPFRPIWKEVPKQKVEPTEAIPISDPRRRYLITLRTTFMVLLTTVVLWVGYHCLIAPIPSVDIWNQVDSHGHLYFIAISRWWDILGIAILVIVGIRYLTTPNLLEKTASAWRMVLHEESLRWFFTIIVNLRFLTFNKSYQLQPPSDEELIKRQKRNELLPLYEKVLYYSVGASSFFIGSLVAGAFYGFLPGILAGLLVSMTACTISVALRIAIFIAVNVLTILIILLSGFLCLFVVPLYIDIAREVKCLAKNLFSLTGRAARKIYNDLFVD